MPQHSGLAKVPEVYLGLVLFHRQWIGFSEDGTTLVWLFLSLNSCAAN